MSQYWSNPYTSIVFLSKFKTIMKINYSTYTRTHVHKSTSVQVGDSRLMDILDTTNRHSPVSLFSPKNIHKCYLSFSREKKHSTGKEFCNWSLSRFFSPKIFLHVCCECLPMEILLAKPHFSLLNSCKNLKHF